MKQTIEFTHRPLSAFGSTINVLVIFCRVLFINGKECLLIPNFKIVKPNFEIVKPRSQSWYQRALFPFIQEPTEKQPLQPYWGYHAGSYMQDILPAVTIAMYNIIGHMLLTDLLRSLSRM